MNHYPKKALLLEFGIFILSRKRFGNRPIGYILREMGMRRLQATIRIRVKNNETGAAHKIELVRPPFSSRQFMLKFDGKTSRKAPAASLTQVCARLRKLLLIMAKQKTCSENR